MGWAIGYDSRWSRDVGYGVPATCDHLGCGAEIDRGLAFVCGGEPFGGDDGCGLFFCTLHMRRGATVQVCERCESGKDPFTPTPDAVEWVQHKLTDPSWQGWRDENPVEVERMRASCPTPRRGRRGPGVIGLSGIIRGAICAAAISGIGEIDPGERARRQAEADSRLRHSNTLIEAAAERRTRRNAKRLAASPDRRRPGGTGA